MKRKTALRNVRLTMFCFVLAALPSLAQTTEEKLILETSASEPAPQVAQIQAVQKVDAPTTPAQPRRQAPNPKLGEASCPGLDVSSGAPGVLVFDDGFETGDLGPWQSDGRFSARGALDLEFSAHLVGFTGEALLRIELTSPRGHAHQTLEAPVVASASLTNAPQSRRVEGYPYPVAVRMAVPGPATDHGTGSQSVSMLWPLAGTHIVSHGLYGEWTATASLVDITSPDGASIACPAASFTLIP